MSSNASLLIEDTNLSYAWRDVFLHFFNNRCTEISPLVITLTGFNNGLPNQDAATITALDQCLKQLGELEVDKVAQTIFPTSYWQLSKDNRQEFFNNYIDNIDNIKAAVKPKHPCEYFERLIAFGSGPHNGNQLEHIISEYNSVYNSHTSKRSRVRRSMFQASIFDPKRDHKGDCIYLPFPCLGHISFVPNKKDGTLILNAFYATQKILEKGYGNYLGLCRLGHFMASEMGLKFERMNCFVGVAKMETAKYKLQTLVEKVRQTTPSEMN
ncbi:thymidylate synthase [Plectonema cf. radiosum LEGE 06105]|uniref:Thymidylate synthase n=1 Tax=Plectonema cf. radiosum LEGE 06105 TaxID=945769 RepID=A0A8J7K4I4_9CYAN|nr:thymidylate synthase [Plectonema radiosum]MBE9214707.1 thymidylate synthase [Plectonema cf. radiosum LEGE 06105]